MIRRQIAASILSGAMILAAFPVNADLILFANVDDSAPYVPNGNSLAAHLAAAGHTVTTRFLDAAVYNDYANFDQVWVYDLYTGANNTANQQANYANIGAWYNALAPTEQNLIADGRIISSSSAPWTPEPGWIQGYANSLGLRGGGLVLGTDHQPFVDGINSINAAIGINLFFGNVPVTEALVDQLSPLFVENGGAGTHPCTGGLCVWDNSSPSFAPTGLQPNGTTLTPVAYHGTTADAFANAAISTTMGSITFGTCGGPNQPPCTAIPEPATLALFGLGLAGLGWSRRKKA